MNLEIDAQPRQGAVYPAPSSSHPCMSDIPGQHVEDATTHTFIPGLEHNPLILDCPACGGGRCRVKKPKKTQLLRLTEMEKKLRRQASNREAARRSRERKNLLINELLQEVGLLEQENESLATEVTVMTKKNAQLLENICEQRQCYRQVMEQHESLVGLHEELCTTAAQREAQDILGDPNPTPAPVLSPLANNPLANNPLANNPRASVIQGVRGGLINVVASAVGRAPAAGGAKQ